MKHLNMEMKARCADPEKIRNILKEREADFKGLDHQIDTYFQVNQGRLKLRQGNIEKTLIFYQRENQKDIKQCDAIIIDFPEAQQIKELLTRANGVLVVVDKKREIYFINNVKFHIDQVKSLGNFVEIEAIDEGGHIEKREKLFKQCQEYLNLFGINDKDLIDCSYSDLLLKKNNENSN
jgi:adenylate cyclase, class 2